MSNYICADCGTYERPVRSVKGSLLIEIILWLCAIVPGLIYSIWRHSTSAPMCRACGSRNVVTTDTPKGQKLYQEYVQFANAQTEHKNAELDAKYGAGKSSLKKSIKQVFLIPVFMVGVLVAVMLVVIVVGSIIT